MDRRTLLHPTGPLPTSTYWLRRAAVTLLVLFVVGIVVLLALPHGRTHPTSSVTVPTSSTPPAPTSATVTSPAVSSAAPSSSSPAASGSAPAGALPTCDTSTLTATVSPSATSYPAGTDPRFTVELRASGAPCAAAGALTLEVVSGNDRVWGSADCTPTSGTSTRLGVGGQSAVRTWDRQRTEPGCGSVPASERSADAGTYKVTASWGGVTSATVAFSLR